VLYIRADLGHHATFYENSAAMSSAIIVLLALSLASRADAQIPKRCANFANLTARECCPTPNVTNEADPGPCGVNIGRGSCQQIGNYQFTDDVRQNWPLGYFDRVCVCSDRFGGYDCGECSFAYVGNDCSQTVIRKRKSLERLTDGEWRKYHNILNKTRNSPSRYMVVTIPHTTDVQALIDSMVNPTLYELFVWMHHFAAKDSELNTGTLCDNKKGSVAPWSDVVSNARDYTT